VKKKIIFPAKNRGKTIYGLYNKKMLKGIFGKQMVREKCIGWKR